MESIWNDFAKLVGRTLAERWLRRQGISTEGKGSGIGKKFRAPTKPASRRSTPSSRDALHGAKET